MAVYLYHLRCVAGRAIYLARERVGPSPPRDSVETPKGVSPFGPAQANPNGGLSQRLALLTELIDRGFYLREVDFNAPYYSPCLQFGKSMKVILSVVLVAGTLWADKIYFDT
ncbi:hypothetical protein HYN51_14145 [Limnobaculum parvum]|uniref:Uncharacterized protein n=1 Tax=Limnobaculum parvum TaxID=2172103 RepID=A0A2Y9U0K5_9GAMM|nr:hypothetical protein HYN51_14145 [Limnobaculum parvum]